MTQAETRDLTLLALGFLVAIGSLVIIMGWWQFADCLGGAHAPEGRRRSAPWPRFLDNLKHNLAVALRCATPSSSPWTFPDVATGK